MAQARNSSQFVYRLVGGPDNALSSAFRNAQRDMCSSPAAGNGVGLPTLGNTGFKFNSSRWTKGGAEEGLSIFDTKGAMEAIQNGPDEAAKKRAHPAALAHANRIARAQQQGATLWGYKLMPDLTPGRAFMWGSFLAVYVVGAATLMTCRALDINSVGEVREKMQAAFAPYKAALQDSAGATKSQLEIKEQPEAIQKLQSFGETFRRAVS